MVENSNDYGDDDDDDDGDDVDYHGTSPWNLFVCHTDRTQAAYKCGD